MHPREESLDLARGVDEILRVAGVLLDPGCDGKDVGVEDDVLRHESCLLGEELVGAAADLHLALEGVGLAELVEGHHDSGCPVLADEPRLLEELLLAALEADRVAHALALQAFEARLEHRPFGAVDHYGDASDLGLGRDEVEKANHRGLGVEEVRVHVDVEQVGAAAHLLQRDLHGAGVVAALDQAAEANRSGDVGALADHDEPRILGDVEGFEPAEVRAVVSLGNLARRYALNRLADLADVLRPRAAAPAGRVEIARLGELLEQAACGRRLFVVAAERVGQSSVGVAVDVDRRDS